MGDLGGDERGICDAKARRFWVLGYVTEGGVGLEFNSDGALSWFSNSDNEKLDPVSFFSASDVV